MSICLSLKKLAKRFPPTIFFQCFCGFTALLGSLQAAQPSPVTGITERALSIRSHPRGKTMFTLLPPEITGVRASNDYADPQMWGALYQEFLFGAIGTGVAIGDYDGDGRPDIFVVSKTESCHLFRNLGNFKFEDVTEKAGVGDRGDAAKIWKQGVTFVDINNDGRLDIYICRFNAPNLLYINQGDGTFKEMAHAYGLDVSDSCVMASFCDYDRDGLLDVYIATNLSNAVKSPRGQRGYLFHNDGNGHFTNVTDGSGIQDETQSHSATWWDFDNDGWPDLYVANDYGVSDKLYHNNHDGTFTNVIAATAPHTSFASMGSDLGDINNDGLIDFFVADMAGTTHEKFERDAADIRAKRQEPKDSPTLSLKYGRNALLLNTGRGPLLEAAYLAGIAITDWTWSVRFEDLDNDGRLDLFVTNGMNVEENADLAERMMSVESTAERISLMKSSPLLREKHFVYRNRGDLQFEDVSASWGLDQTGISFGAAFGDLSGDGNLDLVYSNYHDTPTLLRNDADTGHKILVDLRGTVSNRFGVGATVRIKTSSGVQVRQLWLARGYMSSSEPVVHFGLGNDSVVDELTVTWPSGTIQSFQNLSVDRRFTITEPARNAQQNVLASSPAATDFSDVTQRFGLDLESHEESVDEAAQQPLLPMRANRRGPAIAFCRDHKTGTDTLFFGGTTLTPAKILRRTTADAFTPLDTANLLPINPVDDGPALFFDAKGDGTMALLITKGGNIFAEGAPEYQPQLFFQDASGGFIAAPANAAPSFHASAGAVTAADFDHSGRLGVFIGGRILTGQYPLSPPSALFANRGGQFEDVTDQVAPELRRVGMVTSALWTDVDNDGWPDLLLTLEWGTVKYFHNNQGKSLEDWSTRAGFTAGGTGWWNSLAAADFNGDGRMDYVVGNVGLNTQYHATPQYPAVLYYGDFKGETSQLIEGYYENGRLYPWRSRREFLPIVPGLRKRYPGNDQFALATLDEIVGNEKLKAAQRFEATELRSGVFLSQPDGTYRFEALPRVAQISPFQGIVAGDFNGDGYADIYAAQNSYAPPIAAGRFDGGLSQLLLGDGRGHFTPVPPLQSGLFVPGDAKAVAVVDLDRDGRPDFIVSRNNDRMLAFKNNGLLGGHFLRIVLEGDPGNPTGIGSKITVQMKDDLRQTSEASASAGYYSQSTSEFFFGFTDLNRPAKVQVRWPSGTISEHTINSESSLVLKMPKGSTEKNGPLP